MADGQSKTKMWQKTEGAETYGRGDISSSVKRKSDHDEDQEPYRKKTESSLKMQIGAGFAKNKTVGPSPKLKFGIGSSVGKDTKPKSGISIGLSKSSHTASQKDAPIKKPSHKLANVFNEDSESDEEEMPPEAKMRMKNVGKFTPTSAGPNSYGKGTMGFCDRLKMMEKELQRQVEEEEDGES